MGTGLRSFGGMPPRTLPYEAVVNHAEATLAKRKMVVNGAELDLKRLEQGARRSVGPNGTPHPRRIVGYATTGTGGGANRAQVGHAMLPARPQSVPSSGSSVTVVTGPSGMA